MGPICRRILELIQRYRLDDYPGEPYRRIRTVIERDTISEEIARALLPGVEKAAKDAETFPMPLRPPPTADQMAACGPFDFQIGSLLHNSAIRVGLRLLDAVRCINIVGQPGSGKTLCARLITTWIDQLAEAIGRPIPQIIFDPKGGDYADLPHILGSRWKHLSVHDGMRVGLQAPRGVPAIAWVNTLSTIIAGRMGMIAAATTLSKMILCLLEILNPDGEPYQVWPDFQLLLDVARAVPLTLFSPKDDYGRTLLRALEAICLASGNLFRTFNGLDIERDIIQPGRSVVIDMPNLNPPFLRAILIDILVAQVLHGRIARHYKTDRPEVCLAIDEADQYASEIAARAFADGMSIIGQLLAQGREEGLLSLLSYKSLNGIDPFVLSGAQYQLIFRQSDYESFSLAEKTLDLPRGSGAFLRTLPAGVCLFQMAQLGWPHAMLLKIDQVSSCRQPPPEKYDTHPYVPARRLEEMPDVLAKLQQMVTQGNASHARKVRAAAKTVSKHGRALLDVASLHPYFPVARLWEKIGGVSEGARAIAHTELAKQRLALLKPVRIAKSTVLLIEITDAGWQLLNKPAVAGAGRGGIVHVHFANWIRMVGEKRGYKARCEYVVQGGTTSHAVDVAWLRDDEVHVFEIVVTSEGNIASHIDACLRQTTPVTSLTIVHAEAKELCAIRRQIESDIALAPFLPRLRFEVIQPYMKELWP
jgi:hypothetical protein